MSDEESNEVFVEYVPHQVTDLTPREAELAQAFIHGHRMGENARTCPVGAMKQPDKEEADNE